MFRLLRLILALAPVATAGAAVRHVVLISGEFEYSSRETLARLGDQLAQDPEFSVTMLTRRDAAEEIPGLEAVGSADLLITIIRRMTLPPAKLQIFRDYLASGRPLIALRSSCHAFQNWRQFDPEILGGNYHAHYRPEELATVRRASGAEASPLLRGVAPEFPYGTQLYQVSPLAADTHLLLTASLNADPAKTEPVAWTRVHGGSRIFFSSLGAQNDFSGQPFMTLIGNAIGWALNDDAVAERLRLRPIDHLRVMEMSPEELFQDRTLGTYTFLDIRPAAEFARGHIRDATNLDPAAPDFARRLAALDPLRNVAVLGPTAAEARTLAQRLHDRGFAVVYFLNGSAPTS